MASPDSKTPSSRLSATTIEVPVFLQPVAYDPASAPPLPELRQPLAQDMQNSVLSPPEPERLPPPPPQKIPLGHVETPQTLKIIPQRPWHDSQHSFNDRQWKDPQTSQRLLIDPQNHDAGNRAFRWQNDEQRPTIPTPKFTTFDIKSALPSPAQKPDPTLPSQYTGPKSTATAQSSKFNRQKAGEFPRKSSSSHLNPNTPERKVPTSSSWEPQVAYVPTSEQQHAILSLQDGRSISTTDLSSNTMAVSTPGSHQTSNTSYQENDYGEDRRRSEQQGDDSFYWHSGRSSSDAEEDQGQSGSPTATPGGDSVGHRSSTTASIGLKGEHQDLPVRSTSLSPTTSATYGASALGFGGPSDWEYFGDYEAEEIDDEELYSRPLPRDTKSVVEGSTELPVESTPDSIQSRSESVLPGSDSIELRNLYLQGKTPAKSRMERSSQENVVQDLVSGDGDYETDVKSPAAHSLIKPRAGSGQAGSPSDRHSQQRPDLDEVIRAWSKAPYVGRVHKAAPIAALLPEKNEEPASVAEASLASTPREKLLGVDSISKGAPLLPKVPDSADSQNHDERDLQRTFKVSATPPNAVMTATDHGLQMQTLPDQQERAAKDILANIEVKPRSEENYTSGSENSIEALLPPADLVLSSGLSVSIPPDSIISKTSLSVDRSLDRYPDPVMHDMTQALGEKTQTDSDEKSHSLFKENDIEPDPQIAQNLVQGNSQLGNLKDFERHREEAKSEPSHIKEVQTSHEPTIIVSSSQTVDNLLQGNLLSSRLIISPKTEQGDLSLSLPCNISKKNLDAGDKLESGQNHRQEDEETSDSHANGNISPSKVHPINALAQEIPFSLASNSSIPDHTTPSEIHKTRDPYSDLDPWGNASLNRFAAMLREESRAKTNQDKLNIFNVFASRESRLRVVLYGTDDELIIPQKSIRQKLEIVQKPQKGGFVKQAVERANSIGLEHSLKALPALPTNRESVVGLPGNAPVPLVVQHNSTSNGRGVDLKPRPPGDDIKLKENGEIPSSQSGDDSYVMVDSPSDEIKYSPGGRPIVARLLEIGHEIGLESSQDPSPASEKDSAACSKMPRSSRPTDSTGSNGPAAVGLEDSGTSENPANTPLKYNEGRSEVKNYLANRKSVCRPYATLTQESLESASIFGKGEDVKLAGAASVIISPTSQSNSLSQAEVDGVIGTSKQQAPGTEGLTDLRRFVNADFDPLLLALPSSNAVVHVSARIIDLRNVMEGVPDDFSFIHQSVVAWDAKTKKQREENDKQRHARQVESEQKIDSLFDDHEIGYGDIGELELEFKRSEAARRADEDRFEYQTFVSDVFNLVWTRLHYELDQLTPHYDQYSRLMDHTLAGKDMFEGSEEGLALGPTMSSFLALHQKLEIRHQKAFEAVLERDRRLKKTEISPWYSLSNIGKVKQLEKQFEDAEKKAIIEYCQQRDARANHLMDVLDQNTLRGVGANQDYMEAIMKAVRRIASGRAFASVPSINEPTAGFEEVEKAKAITALLASSSEQVVQTFHVADMLLNSADYEVSVAKAKVAKADIATLAKLKEERAKEDQKLMRELEHRLALIREDTRRTNDEIVKLMLFLGWTR